MRRPRAIAARHAATVQALHAHYPRGTPDEIWLKTAGQHGWVVVTYDVHVRRRPAERSILEAAAEVAREIQLAGAVTLESVRVRVDFLAERLSETARRLGMLRSLGREPRIHVLHALGNFHRVAQRGWRLALAHGCGSACQGLDGISSEIETLLTELRTIEVSAVGAGGTS